MPFSTWRKWMKRVLPARNRTSPPGSRLGYSLQFEKLEERLAPATDIWTGKGADTKWGTSGNWSLGAPNPGDDLVFPSGVPAGSLTVQNNLAAGTSFNSISFSGSGYTLSGNAITLGNLAGGGFINANAQSKGNAINFGLTLGGAAGNRQFFTINFGADLTIGGKLSGSTGVNLTKEGTGLLILGNDNSAFTGPITVDQSAGILQITNNKALGDTNSPTTVLANAQLQVASGTGTINEPLILNGPGINNDGAILNLGGANSWSATVELDSDTVVGSAAGSLNFTNTVFDLGAGHNLTKEGVGTIILSAANTYRGLTTVNNGILNIRNSQALGAGNNVASAGTLVNTTAAETGTLQLEDPTGNGFTVAGELLTLNGPGFDIGTPANPNKIGAVDNLNGNNVWTAITTLGSPPPNGKDVAMGAEDQVDGQGNKIVTSLNFTNTVNDVNGIVNLSKVGPGRIIFSHADTYRGTTDVINGYLQGRDSQAFGPSAGTNAPTTVENGGSLELAVDSSPDSITGTTNTLDVKSENISIKGLGVDGVGGALRSVSGINIWEGTVALATFTVPQGSLVIDGIGVDPDPTESSDNSYFTNDFSLTITGDISGADTITLAKVDTGQLILPNANDYTGPTSIREGWVTIRNNNSLGARIAGIGDTAQNLTDVMAGAALHLKPLTAGAHLDLIENLVLSGNGITHKFSKIGGKGALMSLGGLNTVGGLPTGIYSTIQLDGIAGIGSEQLGPATNGELTITAPVADYVPRSSFSLNFSGGPEENAAVIDTGGNTGSIILTYDTFTIPDQVRVYYPPRGQPGSTRIFDSGFVGTMGPITVTLPFGPGASNFVEIVVNEGGNPNQGTAWQYGVVILGHFHDGGINKWGSKRLNLQGPGTYSNTDEVKEGVLRAQNDSAFGKPSGGVIVDSGAALEFAASTAENNGGVVAGIQVVGESLTLNGPGNSTTNSPNLIATVTNVNNDNMWRGPISLGSGINVDSAANSRVTLYGPIDDQNSASPANITKIGNGVLALSGASTYRGTTFITQGIVNIQSDQALGSASGGTVVSNGATLELQGDITVAGESLTVQGSGVVNAPVVPVRWFQQGPNGIDNGQVPGNQPVSGRVTGVATDPSDQNVIYISTAGGGAWRTIDGGVTWTPMFDNRNGSTLFTGSIFIDPSDPRIIYLGTGEANGTPDSFYGNGVYKSTDSGKNWTLLTGPGAFNPLAGKSISKIQGDTNSPGVIYVATGDQGTFDTPGVGTQNSSTVSNPGIWRYNGTTWFNLTNITSTNRATNKGQLTAPPNTPGPDDEYRIAFPQSAITWTDLIDFGGTLFAALGQGGGSADAVYNCSNPTSNQPIWLIGDGSGTQPDGRNNEYPNPIANSGRQTNTNIKIGASGGQVSPQLYVYAANATPTGTLLDIQLAKLGSGSNAWNAVTKPADYMTIPANPNTFPTAESFGNVMSTLAVDPKNAHIVYVGSVGQSFSPGPFKTINDGGAWTDIGLDANGFGAHVGAHATVFDASNRLLWATDGGLWRFDVTGLSTFSWNDLNGNLPTALSYSVSMNPHDPTQGFVGTQANGLIQYTGNPDWTHVEDGDGGQVRIDPQNSNNVYHIQNGELRRSTSGGAAGSWTNILDVAGNAFANNVPLPPYPTNFPAPAGFSDKIPFLVDTNYPLVLDINNTNRLLVGSDVTKSVMETVNQGNSWVNLSSPGGTPTAIAVSQFQGTFAADPGFSLVADKGANTYDPDTIYVISGAAASNGLRVTKNHGVSWVNRSPVAGNLSYVAVDPRNRDTAYVTRAAFDGAGTQRKVFVTLDGGQTWTNITFNLPDTPAYSVVVDPRNNNVYVGTDQGVFQLANGTSTWVRFGSGLPITQIQELQLNQALNTLTAASYGRSVFQAPLIDSQNSAGAMRSISGAAVWTGSVILAGDTTISAGGIQAIKNGRTNASLNILGTISDQTQGANPVLTKIGGGDVIFAGINTYGGDTIIHQGQLIVQNPFALGDPGHGTFVDPTDPVNFPADLGLEASVSLEPLSLKNDGVPFNGHNTGALRNISNANTYSGPITMLTNTTIGTDSGSQLTVAGSITDGASSFTLTKELTGTLVLAGPNSYDGVTFVFQGALRVADPLALGSTAGDTEVSDGGQLQMANNVTVVGETLKLSGTGIFGTGAMLNFSGNNTWKGPIILTTIPGFAPPTTPGTTITFSSVSSGESLTVDGVISESPAGFGINKVGAGKLVLKQANTFTGQVTVSVGVLNIEDSKALGAPLSSSTVVNSSAALELEANVGDNHVDSVTGNTTLLVNETLTISGAGVSPANAGVLRNIVGNNTWKGPITMGASSSVGASGGTLLAIIGGISGAGAALSKEGTGTVLLPVADTYTGATNVNAGILAIANANALGGATVVVANGATLLLQGNITVVNKTITVNGPGFNGIGAMDANGNETWQGSVRMPTDSSFGADGAADTLTINGQITDRNAQNTHLVRAFTKVGLGTVVMTGNTSNDYIGGTTVNEGVLELNKLGATNAILANLTIGNGSAPAAAVKWDRSNQLSQHPAAQINADGTLNLNDQTETVGALTIFSGTATTGTGSTGNLIIQGVLSMTGGTVTTGAAGSQVTLTNDIFATSDANGPALINGNGVLNLNGTDRNVGASLPALGTSPLQFKIDAVISGTGTEGISKVGNGILALNAFEAYTGTTHVIDGILLANGTLGSVSLQGGTLGGTGVTGTVVGTTGSVVPAGPGTTVGALNTLTTGDMSLSSSNSFGVILNSTDPTTNNMLVVNGTLNLNSDGGTGATLTGVATFRPPIGSSYTIIHTTGGITGTFNGGTDGASIFVAGLPFQISYTNSNHDVVLTREKTDTITNVIPSSNPSVFGQDVVFLATVTPSPVGTATGTPSGTVSFQVDSNPAIIVGLDANSQASIHTSALSVGPHTVVVTYSGDIEFNGSTSSTFMQTVNKDGTTTKLVSSDNPSVFGESLTYTATVTANAPGAGTPSGMVAFTVDTVQMTPVPLDGSGKATLSISNFSVGPHTVSVAYNGDSNFNTSGSSTIQQQVNQDSTTTSDVISDQASPVFGQQITFTATVTANLPGSGLPTGIVTFLDNGQSIGTGTLNGTGTATFKTTTLPAGSHSITARYEGDANFLTSTSVNPLPQPVATDDTTAIVSSNANPAVFGQPVTFTAHVTANAPGGNVPTGQVTFTLDGNVQLPVNLDSSGNAIFAAGPLSVGGHTIRADYTPDMNFNASTTGDQSQNVNQANTTVTVSPSANPSVFGQPVSIQIFVTAKSPGAGTPTGSVTLFVDSNMVGTQALDANGQATIPAGALGVGPHSITATYSGSSNFNTGATAQALMESVIKANTTLTTVQSSLPSSFFGQNITFTTTLSVNSPGAGNPTGTVTFKDGSNMLSTVQLVGGSASLTISSLPASVHQITATYNGDGSFNATTTANAFSQTVNRANTATALSSTANPAVFGQAVVKATVSTLLPGAGTASGSLVFSVDGTAQSPIALDANGTATLPLTALGVGQHSITAVFNGSANFASSQTAQALQQIINRANTVVTVSSTLNPSVFGQSAVSVTVTAAAPGSGTPSGTVTFTVDGVARSAVSLDSSGKASLPGAPLTVGQHSITATYSGSSNFSGGVTGTAFLQNVNKANVTQSVNSNLSSPVFGQDVTLIATISAAAPGAGAPTGTITFLDGSTAIGTAAISNGTASLTTHALTAGLHSITSKYNGDSNFNIGTSATAFPQNVLKADTTTSVGSSLNPTVFGQPITFTITVAPKAPGGGIPSGNVTVTVDQSISLLPLDANGQAVVTTSNLSVGMHTVTAAYQSGPNHNASSTTTPFTQTVVRDDTTVIVTSSYNFAVQGRRPIVLSATVAASAPGSGAPTGSVIFREGTTTLGTGTISNGIASVTLTNLGLGTHSIVATYQGDGSFNAGGVSSPFSQIVYTPNQGYIAQTYVDLLHRSVDPNGLTFWTGLLDQGFSRQQILQGVSGKFQGIESSFEFLQAEVTDMYQTFLHRAPDPGGLNSLANLLALGNSVETVKAVILGSVEYFQTRGNGTNIGFLQALYIDVLGRPLDPLGSKTFLTQLQSGTPTSSVALQILNSQEGEQVLVQSLYQKYLRRAADPTGLSTFVGQLKNGVRDEAVIAQLVASDEYFKRI